MCRSRTASVGGVVTTVVRLFSNSYNLSTDKWKIFYSRIYDRFAIINRLPEQPSRTVQRCPPPRLARNTTIAEKINYDNARNQTRRAKNEIREIRTRSKNNWNLTLVRVTVASSRFDNSSDLEKIAVKLIFGKYGLHVVQIDMLKVPLVLYETHFTILHNVIP